MGMILTSYGDAAYDHEGYPAQVLDDGRITGTHSAETTPRMVGQLVAACACGWTGTTRYPSPTSFDEDAEALALGEWEHTHAIPTLSRALDQRAQRLQQILAGLAADHQTHLDRDSDAGQRRELLEHTLRALDEAAGLTRELLDHARAEPTTEPRRPHLITEPEHRKD